MHRSQTCFGLSQRFHGLSFRSPDLTAVLPSTSVPGPWCSSRCDRNSSSLTICCSVPYQFFRHSPQKKQIHTPHAAGYQTLTCKSFHLPNPRKNWCCVPFPARTPPALPYQSGSASAAGAPNALDTQELPVLPATPPLLHRPSLRLGHASVRPETPCSASYSAAGVLPLLTDGVCGETC